MSSLPKPLSEYLSSRARQVLVGGTGSIEKQQVHDVDKRVYATLKSLAAAGKLHLSTEEALDITIVFPTTSNDLLSQEGVVPIASLISILPALTRTFSIIPKTRDDIRALGLHATCLESLLCSSPMEVKRELLNSNNLFPQISACYGGLAISAKVLGGGRWNLEDIEPESWKIDTLKTKLSLLAILNILLSSLSFNTEKEKDTFIGLVFTLLDAQSSGGEDSSFITPFIDRPLIGDYENVYRLRGTIQNLNQYGDDPRIDLILQMLDVVPAVNDATPGGLLLLRPPGSSIISPFAEKKSKKVVDIKGKGKAAPEEEVNSLLESQITEVRAVLPDASSHQVRRYLLDSRYGGDVGRVIDALLDGALLDESPDKTSPAAPVPLEFAATRRNVFDEEDLDISKLRTGKRTIAGATIDAATKAEILRRVAELSSDDEDDEAVQAEPDWSDIEASDFEASSNVVKVVADGEGTDGGGSDPENTSPKTDAKPMDVETILELAYIKDQSVFSRDATTRRSQARAELRKATGWEDEQIEGWRIMLEKNPKKEKILQKHEFSGNVNAPIEVGTSTHSRDSTRGVGRGRGNGNRGRGQPGPNGGGDHITKEERARQSQNKARHGNHNRKRGHDRKMARGGLPA